MRRIYKPKKKVYSQNRNSKVKKKVEKTKRKSIAKKIYSQVYSQKKDTDYIAKKKAYI